MKFDKRNPFAAWGHPDEEVYTTDGSNETIKLETEGFVNPKTKSEDNYNTVAKHDATEDDFKTLIDNKKVPEAFFTNNEVEQYVVTKTQKEGYDTEGKPAQREYGSAEQLNYYGIQADDLKVYDLPESDPRVADKKKIEPVEETDNGGDTGGDNTDPNNPDNGGNSDDDVNTTFDPETGTLIVSGGDISVGDDDNETVTITGYDSSIIVPITEDYTVVNGSENLPSENTEETKIAIADSETANSINSDTYYKEVLVAGSEISNDVKYYATDKVSFKNVNVTGSKTSNGKINYASSEVEIKGVTIDSDNEEPLYNVFEGKQTVDDNYNGLTLMDASNIVVENASLGHNVLNIYTPADNAVINIKNSNFNLNVNNSNVLRLSNYLNASNVTVNFENVEWNYESGSDENADWQWAGLVIYQPAGNDASLNGDNTYLSTWTFNFTNCKYNGTDVTNNNFGEHNQVMYMYNMNKSGVISNPSDIENMSINFA